MGSRPKVIPGSVECRTCCLLYFTLVNRLSSASSTSSSTVLWCCSQKPERKPRRMTACGRFRSSAVARPHHELAAYTMFEFDFSTAFGHANNTAAYKKIITVTAILQYPICVRPNAFASCNKKRRTWSDGGHSSVAIGLHRPSNARAKSQKVLRHWETKIVALVNSSGGIKPTTTAALSKLFNPGWLFPLADHNSWG